MLTWTRVPIPTIKLLVTGSKDGLQMIALFADHTFEIVFTLQAVLFLHLLRAAGITLRADLQMITWKIKCRTIKLHYHSSSPRGKRVWLKCTHCFISTCAVPAKA